MMQLLVPVPRLLMRIGLLLLTSLPVYAERYQVTEDSFGNYDAKPVDISKDTAPLNSNVNASISTNPPATNPPPSKELDSNTVTDVDDLKKSRSEEAVSSAQPAKGIHTGQTPSGGKKLPAEYTDRTDSLDAGTDRKHADSNDTDRNKDHASEATSTAASTPVHAESSSQSRDAAARERRVLSPFEQAYLDNEGVSPYDATVVNEENFVDGDELLSGNISQPSQQPYFITTDPDGYQSITFYSPELARQAEIDSRVKLKYSPATIYKKSTPTVLDPQVLPSAADPVAISILSGGKKITESYFESFSKRCCTELPTVGLTVIDFERPYHLSLERKDLAYRFYEGDSRYLIFKLPEVEHNFAIQLRAYIRKYKKEAIAHGVFFPQLVMLDKHKQPLRIVSEPVLSYQPETWSSYGYLEGVFEVEREHDAGEHFVLLNTTRQSLKTVSEVEAEHGMLQIEHMGIGEFGVKALYAEAVGP